MKKTFVKSVLRDMRRNAVKLITVSFIILLGVAFVSGLGTLAPTILDSVGVRLSENNAADIIVKSTSLKGFTDGQIEEITSDSSIKEAQTLSVIDMPLLGKNSRFYILPDGGITVNRPILLSGRMPEGAGEIAVEQPSDAVGETAIGDVVEGFGVKLEVVGIVANPLIFTHDGEPDVNSAKPLEFICYLRRSALPQNITLPITDIYIALGNKTGSDYFSKSYKDFVNDKVETLKSAAGGGVVFLTLEQNKSCVMLKSYCDKVTVIAMIFPVFFIAVAALVVLTTMTRMIEEERSSIACCKTLGVSDVQIILKYVSLSAFCCILAAAVGMAIGLTLLPSVIYPAFDTIFMMPQMSGFFDMAEGLIAAVAMFIAVVGVTAYVIARELRGQPAGLMQPKSPKPGKKTVLERIPFVWNKLSFRNKSSLRNILRRLSRLVMTVVSVAGSTALVFAGFALLDVSKAQTTGFYAGVEESMSSISVMIIFFAMLLCIFVIYNLTNMNIGERRRELATLKVLGYRDAEVAGYIYREIMFMAVLGILFGIALGVALITGVLNSMEFGSIADVKWYSYISSGLLVAAFIGVVDLLLIPKILAVDMISSLKSID